MFKYQAGASIKSAKSTKSSHIMRVWSYFGWQNVRRGQAISNIPEQRNKVIFSLLEEEAKI